MLVERVHGLCQSRPKDQALGNRHNGVAARGFESDVPLFEGQSYSMAVAECLPHYRRQGIWSVQPRQHVRKTPGLLLSLSGDVHMLKLTATTVVVVMARWLNPLAGRLRYRDQLGLIEALVCPITEGYDCFTRQTALDENHFAGTFRHPPTIVAEPGNGQFVLPLLGAGFGFFVDPKTTHR